MREAFAGYLQDNQSVKAIFVGTRRTDPHGGNLRTFEPTDGGWPAFMRLHPVIEWHYVEVWAVSLSLAPACIKNSRNLEDWSYQKKI